MQMIVYANSTDHTGVDKPDEIAVTPQRRQHGAEVATIDGVSRVQGALAGLLRSGEIDGSHAVAAKRWYRDWVMGVEGATDASVGRSGKAPDPHAAMLARIAACGRCADVRRCLGERAEQRLRMVVLEDLSFSEIARRLMPGDANGRKKIAAQTVFLLEMLAEHYHVRDCSRPSGTATQKVPEKERNA